LLRVVTHEQMLRMVPHAELGLQVYLSFFDCDTADPLDR
jgi:hypothetical protein